MDYLSYPSGAAWWPDALGLQVFGTHPQQTQSKDGVGYAPREASSKYNYVALKVGFFWAYLFAVNQKKNRKKEEHPFWFSLILT